MSNIHGWEEEEEKKENYGEFGVQRRVIDFTAAGEGRRDGGVVIFINVSRGFIMIF